MAAVGQVRHLLQSLFATFTRSQFSENDNKSRNGNGSFVAAQIEIPEALEEFPSLSKQTTDFHTAVPDNNAEKSRESLPLYLTRKYGRSVSARIQTGASAQPRDFVPLKLIGKGDVGRVYLVKRVADEKLFAMKVLSKQEMVRRNKVHRALAEQEMLAALHHPFVVRLHYSFQSASSLHFVMEYCAGGEFFRTLQQRPGKRLPETSARFYASEVVLALEYLHLQGFVYRDLKPENILLHESGHIRLTDFDLCKPSETRAADLPLKATLPLQRRRRSSSRSQDIDTSPCTRSVRTNSFVGTLEYLSPEIVRGNGHTAMVDFWTLGILIYEMLWGKTPFEASNRNLAFHAVLYREPSFPAIDARSNKQNPSADARNLVKKLLVKDPTKRLGHRNGMADVKAQPWFQTINFALLRNCTPPIVPLLTHREDTRNFREIPDTDNFVMNMESSRPRAGTLPAQPTTSHRLLASASSTPRGSTSDEADPFANFDSLSINH